MTKSNVAIAQALSAGCPNCGAAPDRPCTQPTDNSRRAVRWVHVAREGAYLDRLQAPTPLA